MNCEPINKTTTPGIKRGRFSELLRLQIFSRKLV